MKDWNPSVSYRTIVTDEAVRETLTAEARSNLCFMPLEQCLIDKGLIINETPFVYLSQINGYRIGGMGAVAAKAETLYHIDAHGLKLSVHLA